MTDNAETAASMGATGNRCLALLLVMAMFLLVVDTSLMNVSIASLVRITARSGAIAR